LIFCGFFGKKPRGVCQDGLDARENKLLTGKSHFFLKLAHLIKKQIKTRLQK